jgi:hypothetical protein
MGGPAHHVLLLGAKVASEPGTHADMGLKPHAHVKERFSAQRLVNDLDRLYRELIVGGWDAPADQAGRNISQR